MSARFGSASPQSLVLLFVQCVSLFFLLIYVAAQQTNAEQQQQQQQQQEQLQLQQQQQQHEIKAPNNDADASIELHQNLRFEPATIDFGQWPVGTAHSHTVTLINQHLNRSVILNSVSGRTPSFYSSFFEHKIIAPQCNTTFQVVFLPRENGEVDTELFIHTSFGQSKLTVRGIGRECPYRLRPLTGIKAPLNATLTPLINMFNPHNQPLQILEIYSSGGQFQLELPSGGLEGPQALWAIPAYTEKPIIRIRFHARNAGNFSAYIRIKIATPNDNDDDLETVLVIPVEFEILAQTGLYTENPIIDFGRLSSDNANRASPPKIKLQFKQSNVHRPHDFLGFNMRVLAGLIFDPTDNSIILDPRKFNESIILDELVLLRAAYKRNISALQEFSVRLRAHIFKGSLHYKQNITTFLKNLNANSEGGSVSDSNTGPKRQVIVQNNFQVPLAIFNVSVIPHLDSNIFNLQLMPKFNESMQVLQPGSKLNLLHVILLNDTQHYANKIVIHTNITTYEITLAVCSGRLHVAGHNLLHIPLNVAYNASLHLGAIPNVEISHQGWVTLINRNPAGIRLNNWNFESPRGFSFQVALMGCVRNVDKYLKSDMQTVPIEHVEFRFCNHMAAGDVVIYEVALQEYMAENKDGTLNIWTPFEHIKVNVKFHSWKGKIELVQDKVNFPNCFPGKICTSDIYIISGLPIAIELGSIEFNNDNFKFKNLNHTATTIIQPRTVTKIGRVHFDANKVCPTRCYIPPFDRLTNKRIAFPGPRPNKSGGSLLFDELELRRRTELFRQLRWYLQTVVFTLTTRKVYQFQIPMAISSEWPKLVRGGRQMMPLLEVGQPYVHNIIVTNPADVPLLVDYVISDHRAPNVAHLSLPLEVMDLSASCLPTNKPVFSLDTPVLREPVLIPPNGHISLPIRFESGAVDSYCTLLHLRNNLTLYEPVWIGAKTVQPQFRFGNRKPGNVTPMMFEIKQAHLAACHEDFPPLPLVAVKRSFMARNAGELPILIDSFYIGEKVCEGYGFKVLDCQSFELKANSSRKVEISFTPDFSLSRVHRPLVLHTNLSSVEFRYDLLATLPAVNLDICSRKLPRPAWEKSVRNAVMMLMASTFIFVILATHIDFTNIMYSQTLLYNVRQRGPIYPTFNLRNIMQRPFQGRNAAVEENENTVLTDNISSTSNGNGTLARRNSLNEQTSSAHQSNNNNNNNNSGGNNHVRKRGRKSGTNSNSPAVGIGRNMSLTTTNALESGLLQNLIIMSNNPNDNRVIVVAPKRRDSTPSPVESPIKTPTDVESIPDAASSSPTTSAVSTTWPSTPTDSESPSPFAKNNEGDKEHDRESGISISSTTSVEMETNSSVKKKQQQMQHVSRIKRSKLLAQDKKAEKEREREKLRERQLEKEREREKVKIKEQEKEKQKEKDREKRERDQRYREQMEKERLEIEELERQREIEIERAKEREREKERMKKNVEKEKQKEMEKEKEQRQSERQKDLDQREMELKQREKIRELERQKDSEQQILLTLERENERKLQLQREQEKERQLKKAAELEREKQKELKRQREKEQELERERQKQMEREKERKKERERMKERQKELEKERKKEKEKKLLKTAPETLEGNANNVIQKETNCQITEKEKDKKLIIKDKEIKVDEKEKSIRNVKEDVEKIIDRNQPVQQEDKDLSPPLKPLPTVTRKYGKTPGRERRRDGNTQFATNISSAMCQDDVNNQVEKKYKHKAVQALSFRSVLPVAGNQKLTNNNKTVNGSGSERSSPNCLARSLWEAGTQVSLGDLIQKPPSVDVFNRQADSSNENVEKSASTASQTPNNNNNNNTANELGPIGSRKSPSSTPLWESVIKQQPPEKPQFPKPIITNNSSFFSNLPGSGSPNLNSFGLGDGQFMGIPTNLYELQKVQMELQRQLQTNEFIINLHQQQQRLQQQQELLQGAGDIAAAATATMAANNHHWTNPVTIAPSNNNNSNNNINANIKTNNNGNNNNSSISVSSSNNINKPNNNQQNNNHINNNSGGNNNNNNNNNGGAAWSPMGYRQAVDLNLVNNVNTNHNLQQAGPSTSISSNNININHNDNSMGLCINNGLNNATNSGAAGGEVAASGLTSWQQMRMTRPPPGLNASTNSLQKPNFQPLQQQQQQPQQQGQSRQQPDQQQQQQQQQQQPIQQFDPFKSLSSIWSDNWNRNGSN